LQKLFSKRDSVAFLKIIFLNKKKKKSFFFSALKSEKIFSEKRKTRLGRV